MHSLLNIAPNAIALLLVDLQEEHRRDQRFLAADYAGTLANAARLLAAARQSGVAVYHARYVRDFANVPPRPFEITAANGEPGFSDVNGGLTDICPEVAPLPGETVLVKNDASSFAGTDLSNALKNNNIEWLVVAGAWTEACVAATLRDAISLGFCALLVKDACASGTATMHRVGILNLANRLLGGAVADTASAVRILSGAESPVWRLQRMVPFRFDAETIDTLYDSL